MTFLLQKMHAYGFSKNSMVFFYSYLKRRKQNVRINNTQGSILGSILLKIFIIIIIIIIITIIIIIITIINLFYVDKT